MQKISFFIKIWGNFEPIVGRTGEVKENYINICIYSSFLVATIQNEKISVILGSVVKEN